MTQKPPAGHEICRFCGGTGVADVGEFAFEYLWEDPECNWCDGKGFLPLAQETKE